MSMACLGQITSMSYIMAIFRPAVRNAKGEDIKGHGNIFKKITQCNKILEKENF